MGITRRDCFKLLAGSALALSSLRSGVAYAAAADGAQTLKAAAAAKGLYYGAANSSVMFSQAVAQYRELFLRQCALFAPSLWGPAVSPSKDYYDFKEPDAEVEYVTSHGLKLSGGHLLWYMCLPHWIESISDKDEAEKAIVIYAYKLAKHYEGKVFSWNVLNEAINPLEGRPDGLRHCYFTDKIGANYINLAFRSARTADPKAILAWNEYGMELDTPEQEARRTAFLKLLDKAQADKTPIDAVGLQSHLKLKGGKFDEKRYRAFLKEVASRELKILITELDVLDVGAPSDIARRDQEVADIYSRFLTTALDEPAVKSVVTWGLSDRYTWLTGKYDPAFIRADGLPTRPLPFDADFKPTLAFDAIVRAFNGAPERRPG